VSDQPSGAYIHNPVGGDLVIHGIGPIWALEHRQAYELTPKTAAVSVQTLREVVDILDEVWLDGRAEEIAATSESDPAELAVNIIGSPDGDEE